MPIYEAVCSKCDKISNYYSSVANRAVTPECCGKSTQKRVLSPPVTHMDIQPWDSFVSPATGKMITSKSQRREDMKASGCRDWEGMESEKKLSARRKAEIEASEDKSLTESVAKAVAQLPPDKKKLLSC